MKKLWFPVLLLSLLLVATSLSFNEAYAQAVYGSVSGNVSDASGAAIAGATVTITSVERRTSDTVQTNDSGLYTKERLLPGAYEVKVEQTGFKQTVVPSVVVSVDTSTSVDVALEPGQVSETVTVSSEGQLLKTDRSDVATTFDNRQVAELPILTRNFARLILLTPGAEPLAGQTAASENPQGSLRTQVNGQSFTGIGYQLDGTDNRDAFLGQLVISPTLESVGETKITSQNYDAEFGQAVAGVVSVQTKSGRNDFFGSLFAFRQNDVLQARNPFTQFQPNQSTGKFLPDTLRNQFGGSLGGRIIPDKLFFFGDYQGTRSKLGGSRLLSVPTLRARTGDLSEYAASIFDPATSVVNGPTLVSRTQFAGNVIPADRLSPQSLALLRLIPLPNAPGRQNGTIDNYVASGSEIFDADAFNVRIDGRLTDNLNIFGRYSLLDAVRNGPGAFGQAGGPELANFTGISEARNQSLALGADYVISPTTVADFRFGYFRNKVDVLPFDFGTAPARDAGIPGLNLDDTFTSGLPAIIVNGPVGDISLGSALSVNRCNCPLDQKQQQYQGVANLTKTIGNHTTKFGTDVRRISQTRVPSDAHRSGELTFNTQRTAGAGTTGGGLGLATFLLGDVTNFRRFVSGSTDAGEEQWRHSYYGQDTWRATPKLTIAYGLRLDVINPQKANRAGNGSFLDLDTGELLVAGVGDIPLNGGVENSLNFGPRLAVAYQLNERLVVRAGYGRSYDSAGLGATFGVVISQQLPVLALQEVNTPNIFDRAFTLAQGPPAFVAPSVPDNGRIRLPNGVNARALLEKQRVPSVDAYNVTLQYQLTTSTSIEAAYVGNKGTHTLAGPFGDGLNINEPTLEGFGTLSLNQRRPYFGRFGWTQNIRYSCNCADTRYNSLQTKLTKRFSQGYAVNASYTLSRALDNDPGQFFNNRELGRGVTDYDRTHTFILTNVAELPFGRGRRFLSNMPRALDAIIGGFQFNSATRIASGLPFNVSYRDAGTDRDIGPNRPDLIGDPQTGGSRDQFFNVTPIGSSGSAFGRPARGTFGNLPRNALRGPNFWNTDASLFKRFYFTETTNLEFRIEASNVFNHVNLGLPDATIGVASNANLNAGRITTVQGPAGNADPSAMRNFQFALRLSF